MDTVLPDLRRGSWSTFHDCSTDIATMMRGLPDAAHRHELYTVLLHALVRQGSRRSMSARPCLDGVSTSDARPQACSSSSRALLIGAPARPAFATTTASTMLRAMRVLCQCNDHGYRDEALVAGILQKMSVSVCRDMALDTYFNLFHAPCRDVIYFVHLLQHVFDCPADRLLSVEANIRYMNELNARAKSIASWVKGQSSRLTPMQPAQRVRTSMQQSSTPQQSQVEETAVEDEEHDEDTTRQQTPLLPLTLSSSMVAKPKGSSSTETDVATRVELSSVPCGGGRVRRRGWLSLLTRCIHRSRSGSSRATARDAASVVPPRTPLRHGSQAAIAAASPDRCGPFSLPNTDHVCHDAEGQAEREEEGDGTRAAMPRRTAAVGSPASHRGIARRPPTALPRRPPSPPPARRHGHAHCVPVYDMGTAQVHLASWAASLCPRKAASLLNDINATTHPGRRYVALPHKPSHAPLSHNPLYDAHLPYTQPGGGGAGEAHGSSVALQLPQPVWAFARRYGAGGVPVLLSQAMHRELLPSSARGTGSPALRTCTEECVLKPTETKTAVGRREWVDWEGHTDIRACGRHREAHHHYHSCSTTPPPVFCTARDPITDVLEETVGSPSPSRVVSSTAPLPTPPEFARHSSSFRPVPAPMNVARMPNLRTAVAARRAD